MSLVYTQTATSPSPTLALPVLGLPKCPSQTLLFLSSIPDFLATWKGLLALAGFLLRLEFGKCAGDISFSNPVHPPIHLFIQQRFAK